MDFGIWVQPETQLKCLEQIFFFKLVKRTCNSDRQETFIRYQQFNILLIVKWFYQTIIFYLRDDVNFQAVNYNLFSSNVNKPYAIDIYLLVRYSRPRHSIYVLEHIVRLAHILFK